MFEKLLRSANKTGFVTSFGQSSQKSRLRISRLANGAFARILIITILAVLVLGRQDLQRIENVLAQGYASPVSQTESDEWFVALDTSEAPLVKEIDKAHERMGGNGPHKDKHEPKLGDLKDNNGKQVGKVIESEIDLEYGSPQQKGKPDGEDWDPLTLNPASGKVKGQSGTENENRKPTLSRGEGYLVDTASNDDNDCVDEYTGEHLTGEACFGAGWQDTSSRKLRQTLLPSGDGLACFHEDDPNTILFPAAECEEREWTTLVELIDEDGVDDLDLDGDGNTNDDDNDGQNDDNDCTDNAGGHAVGASCNVSGWYPLVDEDGSEQLDNDGDNMINEDGPNTPPGDIARCRAFYEELGVAFDPSTDFVDGECNLDNATTKGINKKANDEFGKNVFDDGTCDPADPDSVACSKNDWEKDLRADGRTVVQNYVVTGHPYQITLTVTDTAGRSNSCSLPGMKPADAIGKSSECTDDGTPDASFEMTCANAALEDGTPVAQCTFSAGNSHNEYKYEWSLGKIPPGQLAQVYGKEGKAHDKGQEPRKVTVTETMIVRCEPGYVYEEEPVTIVKGNGEEVTRTKVRCRKDNSVALYRAAAPTSTALWASSAQSSPTSYQAMMGFTFAPPILEWGWRIRERVCIFGWCFEIFYARIGYEFNIAAGMRLPVELDVLNMPENGEIWAEQNHTFQVQLTPVDFTVQDYEDFCNAHDLDSEWYIANCQERFSFPDFLMSDDGDEFVAQYDIFAGITVRVLSIPIINWGIESGLDLAQACTMYNVINNLAPGDLMGLAEMGTTLASMDPEEYYQYLKDEGILCGSFTTPFGFDDGDRRIFPFMMPSYHIPADCVSAYLEGQVVTIKGRTIPICTNLILGTTGASLGVGVTLETWASSTHICADWGASGDAARPPGGASGCEDPLYGVDRDLDWAWTSPSQDAPVVNIGPVNFDNYDLKRDSSHDYGYVEIDDFVYWLDLGVTLYANLEFGGILSPIPDIGALEIYSFAFSDTGAKGVLPIPQHPGTEPVQIPIFVKNHGLDLTASPDTVIPEPHQAGSFTVAVTNVGSLPGTFNNFRAELSNIHDQTPPYDYRMETDNDGDGMADEDPTVNGKDEDNDGLDGEDPGNETWTWAFSPAQPDFGSVSSYGTAQLENVFSVTPFWHFMTGPGLYPVKVMGDSVESKQIGLQEVFPGIPAIFSDPYYDQQTHVFGRYVQVFDVAFIEIQQFMDPRIAPPEDALLSLQGVPGVRMDSPGRVLNGGNVNDTILVSTQMIDFNTSADCTLTNAGKTEGCPYRVEVSMIGSGWISANEFPGSYGPLVPGQYRPFDPEADPAPWYHFIVAAPSDWAGMENAPYQFLITASSANSPSTVNEYTYTYTVEATTESRARYILKEVSQLQAEIENVPGDVKTCGLLQIVSRPMTQQVERALQLVIAGDADQAANALAADANITLRGFLHALDGCKSVPDQYRSDWLERAIAIGNDLLLASGSSDIFSP